MVAVAAAADDGDNGEAAEHHERVGQQVEQRPADPTLVGRLQPDEHIAGVADRRVGQHALDVALHEGEDRSHQQRQHGHRPHDGLPLLAEAREGGDEHPQQAGEASGLGDGGHEAGSGRGRPLVDVGRPRVERRERGLEAGRDEQHREPDVP